MLEDENPAVRINNLRGFATLRPGEESIVLARSLKDKDPEVV